MKSNFGLWPEAIARKLGFLQYMEVLVIYAKACFLILARERLGDTTSFHMTTFRMPALRTDFWIGT